MASHHPPLVITWSHARAGVVVKTWGWGVGGFPLLTPSPGHPGEADVSAILSE